MNKTTRAHSLEKKKDASTSLDRLNRFPRSVEVHLRNVHLYGAALLRRALPLHDHEIFEVHPDIEEVHRRARRGVFAERRAIDAAIRLLDDNVMPAAPAAAGLGRHLRPKAPVLGPYHDVAVLHLGVECSEVDTEPGEYRKCEDHQARAPDYAPAAVRRRKSPVAEELHIFFFTFLEFVGGSHLYDNERVRDFAAASG